MTNPFQARARGLNGPATDLVPVTPSDSADLEHVAVALLVEIGGAVHFVSEASETRMVNLGSGAILSVGVRRVMATGTTATGIHAFVLV